MLAEGEHDLAQGLGIAKRPLHHKKAGLAGSTVINIKKVMACILWHMYELDTILCLEFGCLGGTCKFWVSSMRSNHKYILLIGLN